MTDFSANPEPIKDVSDGDSDGQLSDGNVNKGDASTRMGGTSGVDLTAIREKMEVIGSDGGHVGVIDHVLDDQLKLTRQDTAARDGQHHLVPLTWVSKIDGDDRVMLSISKDEATSRWTPAG